MHHNPLPWGWHPLAYCVPPYFGLAYCVSQCFGLAYCVPFNNKTTIFGNFIYIEKIKWQYAACTCTIILENVKFGVFASQQTFDIGPSSAVRPYRYGHGRTTFLADNDFYNYTFWVFIFTILFFSQLFHFAIKPK